MGSPNRPLGLEAGFVFVAGFSQGLFIRCKRGHFNNR